MLAFIFPILGAWWHRSLWCMNCDDYIEDLYHTINLFIFAMITNIFLWGNSKLTITLAIWSQKLLLSSWQHWHLASTWRLLDQANDLILIRDGKLLFSNLDDLIHFLNITACMILLISCVGNNIKDLSSDVFLMRDFWCYSTSFYLIYGRILVRFKSYSNIYLDSSSHLFLFFIRLLYPMY